MTGVDWSSSSRALTGTGLGVDFQVQPPRPETVKITLIRAELSSRYTLAWYCYFLCRIFLSYKLCFMLTLNYEDHKSWYQEIASLRERRIFF